MDSEASEDVMQCSNADELVARFHRCLAAQDSQQSQDNQQSQNNQQPQDSQQSQDNQQPLDSQQPFSPPLFESTPIPRTRPDMPEENATPLRPQAQTDKRKRKDSRKSRKRSKENVPPLTSKCLGIHSVGLNQLMKAPAGFLSKRSSELQTKNIKSVLMELGVSHLPLLPVITTGEWHGTVHEDDRFIIVGGESLFTAVCDLAANKKFKQYRNITVRIYADLSTEELREVELTQDLQPLFLGCGQESLKARVARFRRILYERAGVGEEEEPPKSNPEWRRICSASVGKATDTTTMKGLEPTFQLALYSRRCYSKLERYFEIQEEKGQDVKQVFHCLQGLAEDVRYGYLCELVAGTLTVSDMRKQSTEEKKLQCVKKEMMKALKTSSWEETVAQFPSHTTPDVLAPYRGLDFKKSVPRSFLELIKNAVQQEKDHTKERTDQTDIIHTIEEAPANCTLAVLDVSEECQFDDDQVGAALGPRSTVVYMCSDLVGAAAIVTSLREKEKSHTYSVVVDKDGDQVRHMICTTRRADGIEETPPELSRVIGSPSEALRTVLERCTQPNDKVLIAGPKADPALLAMREKREVVYLCTGDCSEEERIEGLQTVLSRNDNNTYDFPEES